MRTRFTLLIVLLLGSAAGFAQQIPNGSFETWTNANTPTGWAGVEDLLSSIIPIDTSIFTFKDTTTYTVGTASVELVTDTINGPYSSTVGTEPGIVSLGTAYLDISGSGATPVFTGIPFTYRPDSIIFDYKLSSPGGDYGGAEISLTKNAVPLLSYQGSSGLGVELQIDTAWTHMAIALAPYYVSTDYPDTLQIQFVSSAVQNATIGTTLHVDGVRFGYINHPLSVTTTGSTTFCSGSGSATLQANTGGSTGYTYQWQADGANITGATSASYVATAAGTYTVTIDSATSTATSEPIAVTVDDIVALVNGLNDTLCNSAGTVTLSGTPDGGVFSGNGVTSSTFTPSLTVVGLNTITYNVTDSDGCAKSASATILVENCTGINTVAETNLSVYPNPASNLLSISSTTDLAGFSLQLYDLLGRVVVNQILESGDNAINLSKLSGGTYIYRITDKENGIVAQSKLDVIK